MPPLGIIDPALGRTGAHNQGFAELLVKQGAPADRIGIWCSQTISAELRERLGAGGVVVEPAFSVDFYQVIVKEGGVAAHWDWIYQLAGEYLAAMEQALARWPGEAVRLLYHTMSWEHATALSVAIRRLGDGGRRLQHIVLLMYSPGIDQDRRIVDVRRCLNFRLAFAALSNLPGVDLFASCGEYAVAYAALLRRSSPLPLHPCFLGDWRTRPDRFRRDLPEKILLYAGEIKQEKGFLSLPRVASGLLDTTPADCRLAIQFVDVRNDAGRHVLEELAGLAASNDRIELHHGFWPEERLHEALATCSVFRMDYDAAAYAHKTSGLLWLAAWHRLPVALPAGTWLEREARRLGMAVIPAGTTPLAANAVVDQDAFDVDYSRAVFMPFREWLEGIPGRSGTGSSRAREPSLTDIAAEVRAARAARPASPAGPRAAGVDVVLFWKQNDTTLYGRRCDMVARYLASRDDVRKVVVVDAPIGEAELARLAGIRDETRQERWLHSRTLEKLRGACDTEKLVYRVFTYSAHEFGGNQNDGPDPRFLDRYAEFLEGVFAGEQVSPARSVFWVYPRNLAMPPLLERFAPARVVVDVVDDHRAWPGVPDEEKRRLTGNYCSLLASADIALANCAPVQQAMRPFCPGIRLVPNGCDDDPPHAAPDAGSGFDAFLAHAGGTIGYVGNLEAKIDIALLSRVAQRFPDCQLVLIGSTHANPQVRELLRHPNVRLPGVVPYDQLGNWLAKFDVGLIPHLEMDLTRYMNPLKAYVYLSWGVPVVATAVPNVDTPPGLVRAAATHDGFLDQVARALDGGRPPRQAFGDYVKANDWKSRLSGVVDALDLSP